MVWADFLGARDCHVTPMPLALGIASQAPITLPANSPCTILIRAGNVVRDDLTVDIPPLRRTPTARGRTGVDGRSAASGIQRRGTRLSSRYAADRKRPPGWRRFACGRPWTRSAPSQWSLPSVRSSARFAAVSLAHLPQRRAPKFFALWTISPSERSAH